MVRHYDANGKRRIVAGTLADGNTDIFVTDAAGKTVGSIP